MRPGPRRRTPRPSPPRWRVRCSFCDAWFESSRDRDTHAWREHGLDRPPDRYRCRYCFMSTPYRRDLRRHMRRSHRLPDAGAVGKAPAAPDTPSPVNVGHVAVFDL